MKPSIDPDVGLAICGGIVTSLVSFIIFCLVGLIFTSFGFLAGSGVLLLITVPGILAFFYIRKSLKQ